MRNRIQMLILSGALLMLLCGLAVADVPQNMNVQGQLTDSSDAPRVGTFFFTFKIFNAEAGGTEIWPNGVGESHTIVTDAQGTWDASLGSIIALSESVFSDTTRWLEIRVTDGVDPVETLPRVKLGTGPYSYRSASSQQADDADLLDGFNSSAFVNTSGDAMTGDLTWNSGTVRMRADVSTGYLNMYTAAGALNAQFGGSGTSTDIDLYGSGIRKIEVNGGSSFGFIGQYDTDGHRTVELRANSSTGGQIDLKQEDASNGMTLRGGSTTNGATLQMYSGAGGNTIILDADLTGTGAAVLPNGSIQDTEILDEPGIAVARNSSGSGVTLSTGTAYTTIVSRSITIPTSGYIHATARCWVSSTGTSGNVFLQITETAGATSASGYYSLVGTLDGASLAYYDGTATRTWFKTAGTYTFYFQGKENSNASAAAGYSALTLMFFPTAYGTVTQIATQGDVGDFESSEAVLGGSLPGSDENVMQQPLYEVDLRDLELRAARAEAASEKAARELREAQDAAENAGASAGLSNSANSGQE